MLTHSNGTVEITKIPTCTNNVSHDVLFSPFLPLDAFIIHQDDRSTLFVLSQRFPNKYNRSTCTEWILWRALWSKSFITSMLTSNRQPSVIFSFLFCYFFNMSCISGSFGVTEELSFFSPWLHSLLKKRSKIETLVVPISRTIFQVLNTLVEPKMVQQAILNFVRIF